MALDFPRQFFAEMYFPDLGWTDITAKVRQTHPVVTTVGRSSEQGKVPSSKCEMALDNASGDFSIYNPMGAYAGQLGRNTPIQHGFTVVQAQFGQSVTDGWPNADTGEVWTLSGTAANFDSAAGVGTIAIATASTVRLAYLTALLPFSAYELTVDVTIPYGTGVSNSAGHIFRGTTTSDYARALLTVNTAGQVSLALGDQSGFSLGSVVVDTVSAGTYRLRVLVEDDSIRAKAWPVAAPVPYDWQVEATVDNFVFAMNAAGWAGIRATTGTGGTNITFTFDNYQVRVIRFAGQVADLQPRWDESHNVHWSELDASGIMRSLIQGKPFEVSSLRRGIEDELRLSDPDTPAYWPCEDGSNAGYISAVAGPAMTFTGGPPQFAEDDTFACSQPIPVLNGATLVGEVPYYDNSATGRSQVRLLCHIPAGGEPVPDFTTLMSVFTTGTVGRINVVYVPSGNGLGFAVFDQSGVQIDILFWSTLIVNGVPSRIGLDLTQSGANLDLAVVRAAVPSEIGSSDITVLPHTWNSNTFGRVARVVVDPGGVFTKTSIGHVVVQGDVTLSEDMSDELAAWAGESAGDRFIRITGQRGIPARVMGRPLLSALMGVQLPGPVLDLLQGCADAELATLSEDRSHLGLVLRTLTRTYGQGARVTLDYAGRQVAPPLTPKADDQIRNDVIAKRLRGSEYRATQASGPNNVNPPWEDPQGVGPYEHQFTVNVFDDAQLQNTAGVVKGQGTIDEERYPRVTVDLRASGIDAAAAAAVLAVGLDDRLVVNNLTAARVYLPIDQVARGYTETLTDVMQHHIVFNTTPYGVYQVGRWTDGVSRWDSSTSTLATGIASNDMTLSVAFTDTRWTTVAGFFPMTVMVGPPGGHPGELMVISAISATTSPQTFTVSARGQNGFSKAWPVGSEVHVYPRTRWAR